MKLGLINIHSDDCLRYGIVGANGLGYLSAYLKKNLSFEDIFISVDENNILSNKPDIIGISSTTENYSKALKIAEFTKKELKIPVIIGGHHISALPQTLPEYIDVGVIGEGEQTMLELMKLALSDKFNSDYFKDVSGISYRDEFGNVVITQKRKVIDNLDDIPPPDRELLKTIQGYNQSILTTRGCPFDCSFCSATSFWKKVRFHSPERIVSEIECILRDFPHQRMINIDDDLFTININRLKKLVDLIKETGLNKKVDFSVTARASVFTEKVCKLMVEMNVKRLFIGFEYGVDRILKYLKETVTVKQNQKTIDICEKYNMNVVGSFIIGVPIETKEELAKNYWFIKKNFDTLTKVNICFSNPFPDTGFWEYAVNKNKINDSFSDWWKMSLEYKPGTSLFMNENYTENEFTEYFKFFKNFQTFSTTRPIKDSPYTTRYVNNEYFSFLYEKILSLINKNTNSLLEISNQYLKINEMYKDSPKFDLIDSYESLVNNDKKYDIIFCNHFLETVLDINNSLSEIYNLMNDKGSLILSVYNIQYIQILSSLLYNEFKYTYSGAIQYKNLKFLSLDRIQKLFLNNNLKVDSLIRNSNSTFDNKKARDILNMFLGDKINFLESDVLSYIFVLSKK